MDFVILFGLYLGLVLLSVAVCVSSRREQSFSWRLIRGTTQVRSIQLCASFCPPSINPHTSSLDPSPITYFYLSDFYTTHHTCLGVVNFPLGRKQGRKAQRYSCSSFQHFVCQPSSHPSFAAPALVRSKSKVPRIVSFSLDISPFRGRRWKSFFLCHFLK